MKTAIVGSRNINDVKLTAFLNAAEISEVVSGGAVGIDTLAKLFAVEHGIKYVEFLPDYQRFKRSAPIIRNKEIVNYADRVVAFWDGKSKGTLSTIEFARKQHKPVRVITL